MILTETYFRKISGLMLPKENQALEETLAEAQRVLKEAHSKGVELECILEVDEGVYMPYLCKRKVNIVTKILITDNFVTSSKCGWFNCILLHVDIIDMTCLMKDIYLVFKCYILEHH